MRIARWESRSGKYFAELEKDDKGYTYTGNGCGGNLGMIESDEVAVTMMQVRIDSGYFLPDSAKTPMKRVF
jgi:hypothetical protein